MTGDLFQLYEQMLLSRRFEAAVQRLWEQGAISGEMHLSSGEEGITAGIVCQLREGDGLALDHRGTAPLLMRGVDPRLLLREFLGRDDGLCRGAGGHMHLFSREHLAASSGIVGSAGPAGCGFALAAGYLRPDAVSVAFFGEGALNQGMLLESLNLAAAWRLPVLFVCKDNGWAISTRSATVTGGDPLLRASGFGVPAVSVDGADVLAVWDAAEDALGRLRAGEGPAFIHARCVHLEGHFLGDPLFRAARRPLSGMRPFVRPILRALSGRSPAGRMERMTIAAGVSGLAREAWGPAADPANDPLHRARERLLGEDAGRLAALEGRVTEESDRAVREALSGSGEVRDA